MVQCFQIFFENSSVHSCPLSLGPYDLTALVSTRAFSYKSGKRVMSYILHPTSYILAWLFSWIWIANISEPSQAASPTQDEKKSVASGFVKLGHKTEGLKQNIFLKNLVPGKTNTVCFRLENESGEDLKIEKVTVSCGCMVIGAFESFVAKETFRDLSVTIVIGQDPVSQKRDISFEDSDGRIWYVELECIPVKIFDESSGSFNVGFENQDRERVLNLSYSRAAIDLGLVPEDLNAIKCSPSGMFAKEVRIRATETGVELTLVPDWNRFGLKKVVPESVEIISPGFRTAVVVMFENQSLVRVSPSTFSASKLISGGQRFFLTKDSGVGELGVRGELNQSSRVDVEITNSTKFRFGEIFEIAGTNEQETALMVALEFFEKANPDTVLCKVHLIQSGILEHRENED